MLDIFFLYDFFERKRMGVLGVYFYFFYLLLVERGAEKKIG